MLKTVMKKAGIVSEMFKDDLEVGQTRTIFNLLQDHLHSLLCDAAKKTIGRRKR